MESYYQIHGFPQNQPSFVFLLQGDLFMALLHQGPFHQEVAMEFFIIHKDPLLANHLFALPHILLPEPKMSTLIMQKELSIIKGTTMMLIMMDDTLRMIIGPII